MPESPAAYESWGIVEILGHKQYAGLITEQTIAGTAFVRIDIPEVVREGYSRGDRLEVAAHTKFFGPQSIYAIHPCAEQIARAAAQKLGQYMSPLPVEIPRQLASGSSSTVPASVTDVPADLDVDVEDLDGDEDDDLPFDGGASRDDPEAHFYADEEEDNNVPPSVSP